MYLPSLRFSSLSTGFYLACVFPPFSLRTIRLYTCVLSRTEPWLTQYCRESAIAWDHTLSLLSPYLKKKALIAGYCCDALAVPGFQMVAIAQRDVSTKNNPGRVGGKSKGTSSLSSSLFLSSSFFFPLSYFALHSPTSTPRTGYILQRIYFSHSVYYPPKHPHCADWME